MTCRMKKLSSLLLLESVDWSGWVHVRWFRDLTFAVLTLNYVAATVRCCRSRIRPRSDPAGRIRRPRCVTSLEKGFGLGAPIAVVRPKFDLDAMVGTNASPALGLLQHCNNWISDRGSKASDDFCYTLSHIALCAIHAVRCRLWPPLPALACVP
jgi:hypothetical protein